MLHSLFICVGLTASLVATCSATPGPAACCSDLSALLPGKVSFPNAMAYDASLESYWSQQEQALKPSCIISSNNTTDVAAAVRFLRDANFNTMDCCPFAVRSGGHTPFAGSANIQAGITIDLSQINEVVVSEDVTTVRIGVGNRWGAVNHVLDPLGVATPGGRISGVGVGGFTSGGGMSFYSPRLGLVCDATLNFEVILSSGTITNANATHNTDLFRALKGASNNLGIITHIDLPLVPAGLIWGGFRGTDISYRPQIFSYFQSFDNSATYDPYASLIHTNLYINGSWSTLLHMAYTKPGAVDPPVYAPLLDLPYYFSTVRPATQGNLTDEFEAGSPVNSRALLATMTHSNSAVFMETFFQLANATAMALGAAVPGMQVALSYQPWPQTITAHGPANGGNALGIDASDGDLTNIDLTLYWENAEDDDFIYNETKKLFRAGKKKAKEAGVWNEYLYLNYADKWQEPIKGYGKDNVQMLREMSWKYDPTQTFQRAVVGGFKLDE